MGASSSALSKSKFIDTLTREECIDHLVHGYINPINTSSDNLPKNQQELIPVELKKLCIQYTGSAYNLGLLSNKELDSEQRTNQIFVKTLTGKTITLDVSINHPIYLIKWLIQKRENIPCHQQRLIYRGQQLEDQHTVLYYNLHNARSTIHLVLNLRALK
mmetsp:Transcript_22607/g.19889  ORF Transcript_22607/g.19889 Transcript_22607/m.19889 type:complete len:160 (-) Transcript_22607:174-653(-)